MYSSLHADGFHTEAAQANGQNETLTSKSQIIMMIFALRSFGKCTPLFMQTS